MTKERAGVGIKTNWVLQKRVVRFRANKMSAQTKKKGTARGNYIIIIPFKNFASTRHRNPVVQSKDIQPLGYISGSHVVAKGDYSFGMLRRAVW